MVLRTVARIVRVVRQTSAMINNEWVGGTEKMVTLNPATESAIGDVTNCREAEVDMAVEAATDAFYHGEWSQTGGYERGKMMNRLADLIEANAEELARLLPRTAPLLGIVPWLSDEQRVNPAALALAVDAVAGILWSAELERGQ